MMSMRARTMVRRVLPCLSLVCIGLLLSMPLIAQTLFANGFEQAGVSSLNSGVGVNLEGVREYSPEYHFVDAFKQSRAWTTSINGGAFDTDEAECLQLDGNGFVTTLLPNAAVPGCATAAYNSVLTTMLEGVTEAPAGTYTVTFDGAGTIAYTGVSNLNTTVPGRHTFTYNPANGILVLRINAITAGNHLRNIRVWMPGFDDGNGPAQLFHPDFLRILTDARFRSLRFMDWAVANGEFFVANAQADFSDRPLPTDARYTSTRGVPLEIMIALANHVDAEPWFTMPHRASDAYVSAYASLVRSSLDAGRKFHVEYSNEVWNGGFPQGGEIEAAANAAMPGLGDSGFTRRMNQHGHRTAQICSIFRQVFGADSDRVVCVLGAQAANTFIAREALDCPLAIQAGLRTTPCRNDIDAVAIAPYIGDYVGGAVNQSTVAAWGLNDLFTELNSSRSQLFDPFAFPGPGPVLTQSALAIARARIVAHRQMLLNDFPGLELVAYEGGQHLAGIQGVENDAAITALFGNANRDPRMGGLLSTHLDQWKADGGTLFMHFNTTFRYGRFGNWGLLERIDQAPTSAKYNAVKNFIQANPCWWSGCAP